LIGKNQKNPENPFQFTKERLLKASKNTKKELSSLRQCRATGPKNKATRTSWQ